MPWVDIFYRQARPSGYEVYLVGRRGELSPPQRHRPWFLALAPPQASGAIARFAAEAGPVDSVEEVEVAAAYIPSKRYVGLYEQRRDYRAWRVYVKRKEHVPAVASELRRAVYGAEVALANIPYAVRASYDLGARYFTDLCPLPHRPISDLEAGLREAHAAASRLRVLAFDVEVYTEGSRFPRPGSPLISFQLAVAELGDPSFLEPGWWRDNVEVIEASSATPEESAGLAREFARRAEASGADIVVGFNSYAFDLPHLEAHYGGRLGEARHLVLGGRAVPHIDLFLTRVAMGSALGVRSQRALAVDDVALEVAGHLGVKWLRGSELLEAERRLSHLRIAEEWKKRSELFYRYARADAYLALLIARAFLPPLAAVSAMTQAPLTYVSVANPGQLAEYTLVRWYEVLGFAPAMTERKRDYMKAQGAGGVYSAGKVYSAGPGIYRDVYAADFSQLYPTLMAVDCVDPTAIRLARYSEHGSAAEVFSDPAVKYAGAKGFRVLLGVREKKSHDYMRATEDAVVVPTYGPASFLVYRLFAARRVTKRLKAADRSLAPLDQAVKILNNSLYGGMSKQRGFVSELASAYVFWKTLAVFYDVVGLIKSRGYAVAYGDTDSVFVSMQGSEDPRAEFASLVSEVNSYVASKYGRDFQVEERGSYDLCVFPKQKYASEASKKTYICGNYTADSEVGLSVEEVKGAFYKSEAPEAVRAALEEVYAEVVERASTPRDVEAIVRRYLSGAPAYALFVKKVVDSFESEEEEGRLKRVNKPMHYAALHTAFASSLPGVALLSGGRTVEGGRVRFYVDARRALSAGGITVYYLPLAPKKFMVYMGGDDPAEVHTVEVLSVSVRSARKGRVAVEEGYEVEERYVAESLPRAELVERAMESVRRYFIDDIARKLLPLKAQRWLA